MTRTKNAPLLTRRLSVRERTKLFTNYISALGLRKKDFFSFLITGTKCIPSLLERKGVFFRSPEQNAQVSYRYLPSSVERKLFL